MLVDEKSLDVKWNMDGVSHRGHERKKVERRNTSVTECCEQEDEGDGWMTKLYVYHYKDV